MARRSVQPGADIDGFTVGECLHRGGMATLWSVTRPDIAPPLLMKIPRVSEGEDPAAIVSFEMEQMILPRLSGLHVPACFGSGDFATQPYVVIEQDWGSTKLQAAFGRSSPDRCVSPRRRHLRIGKRKRASVYGGGDRQHHGAPDQAAQP